MAGKERIGFIGLGNMGAPMARRVDAGYELVVTDAVPEAVELKPQYAKAHNNLGIVLARSGHLEAAITEFQKALKDSPDSMAIRRNLEAALASRERKPDAGRSESR